MVQPLRRSLLELLTNTLILYQTSPYLSVSTLLKLGATSKSFRDLIYNTPLVFRYLDLSTAKGGVVKFEPIDAGGEVWRSERMDEAVTEEDFYCGPLRGIFSSLMKKGVLQDVQTLILDGLSVPTEVLRDIICDEAFSVKILSILNVKNLNEKKLMQVLRYAVRPSRPKGTPRVKGIYLFGTVKVLRSVYPTSPDSMLASNSGVTTSIGAQIGMQWNQRSQQALLSATGQDVDPWYQASGTVIPTRSHLSQWSSCVRACEGIIAFDAVLCRGPRHDPKILERGMGPDVSGSQSFAFLEPHIATVALGPKGCEVCHSTPEGPGCRQGDYFEQVPLLAPPPLHSSTTSTARRPPSDASSPPNSLFVARCTSCLVDRWCEGCNRFWCESCYPIEDSGVFEKVDEIDKIANKGTSGMRMGIKVHLGLCVEDCLVQDMYNGAGSGGMWG